MRFSFPSPAPTVDLTGTFGTWNPALLVVPPLLLSPPPHAATPSRTAAAATVDAMMRFMLAPPEDVHCLIRGRRPARHAIRRVPGGPASLRPRRGTSRSSGA